MLTFVARSSLKARVLVAVPLALIVAEAWSTAGLDVVASSGAATVALVSPFVAPGDDLLLQATYRGGKTAAIREIVVRGPGVERTIEGTAPAWGWIISVRPQDVGVASQVIEVPLPAGRTPEPRERFDVELTTVQAEEVGVDHFENVDHVSHLYFEVPVRTPQARTAARGAALAVAAAWLAVMTLLLARLQWKRARFDAPGSGTNGRTAGTIGATLAYAAGAGILFPLASKAAYPLSGFATDVALVTAGAILPMLVGRWIADPAPNRPLDGRIVPADPTHAGYREPARPRARPTAAALAKTLRTAGVHASARDATVTAESGRALHRAARSFVEIALSADAAVHAMAIRFNDTELLLRVALALVPVIGPFELVLVRGSTQRYWIDETTSAADVVDAFRAAQREDIALDVARADLLGLLAARRDA